jgi:2'-5' RNA ligase
MSVKKYFIAIVIPEPAYSQIEAIKQQLMIEHGLKGGLRSPSHITLHRPFEWKEEKEGILIEKLKGFNFEQAFEVDLQNFAWFEPRVIYVNVKPNEKLTKLYTELKLFAKRELRLLNEWEDLRGFHPHVTIANRDLKKPKFYELQKEFMLKEFSSSFSVNEFALLRLENIWKTYQTFYFKETPINLRGI